MKATKITFSGEVRIKVEFPFKHETVQKIKKIPDARWSETLKAWHIPYRMGVFIQLKQLFPEVVYPNKESGNPLSTGEGRNGTSVECEEIKQKSIVSVEVLGRTIILRLPKNQTDIHFIRAIRYSRWDGKQFCWIVPNLAEPEPNRI